jgi:hypothetical protein
VQLVWQTSCSFVLCSDTRCADLTVTRNTIPAVENNESIGKGTGADSSFPAMHGRLECTEAFEGGFEYFPFRRLPLWPSTLIRLFEQEEK